MAWRWVNALELLDGTYFYLADPSRSYNDVASYYESIGGSSVTEAALGIAEAARTEAYIDARSNINTAAFGTYRYLLKNGIIIETSKTGSTSSCSWTLKIFDINNNYLAGINSTSNLPYYPLLCGVLVVDDDAERAYFGRCLYNRNTGTGRAVVTYAIEQSESVSNLYTLLKDAIPGGGGGGSNPYSDGGYSEPGGGEDQNFDEVSDVIDLPSLPTYGATGTGFVTAFCPTVQEINDVADYLIQPNIAQVIQGLFAKMSDVIIGLHLLPFVVDASNSKNIELHALAFSIDTQVSSHYADNQYQRLPMGSIDVLKCWDNCLDYNPYTFVSIYLPFCGYFELDTDEVMGKTLTVVYDVDIITGSCVALIQVDGSVMYQFSGMCSCQIPITSVDFNQAVQSLIGLGASAAAGIKMIKGAAAATEEAASRAMAPQNNLSRQFTYENYMEAKMNEQEIKDSVASRLANASVNAVISGKGNYMHAGAVSSAPGFLACRKPFLIIKRPKQSVPEDYESMRGFPSNMKATLGDLSGYTEVEDIHLNIPDATVDEIVECERLLKGGVYL